MNKTSTLDPTQMKADFARGALANAIADDEQGFRTLLQRHGVDLPAGVSKSGVYIATLQGMRVSPMLKKDTSRYLTAKLVPEINKLNKMNFTANESSPFFNADGMLGTFVSAVSDINQEYSNADGSTEKKKFADTTFGQALNSDRVGQYLDAGIGLIFGAIGRKSQKESEAAAMEYERLKHDSLVAATEQEKAKKQVDKTARGWIVPTVIGVSVLGLIVVAVVLIKSKNMKSAAR